MTSILAPSFLRRSAAGLALAAVLCLAPRAHAQALSQAGVSVAEADEQQKAAATAAYLAGVDALEKKKDAATALTKLRESYAVVASPNTHMMIVRALSEGGRWVEAYQEAIAALAEAKAAAAQDPKYAPAVEGIQSDLASIEGRVGLVTVKVHDAPDGTVVSVGGRALAENAWGKPVAVEPGTVEVTLTTPSGEEKKQLELAAGQREEVSFGEAPAAAPQPAAAPAVEEGGYRGPDRRIMAYAAGGVGVLGFIGFGAFGLLANAQFDRLESGCEPDPAHCDPNLESQAKKGRTYQAVANAGLAIGIIGVVAGAGLFVWDVLDPPAGTASAGRRTQLAVGPGSASLRGSF